ncbi:MAG TPA: DNA-processing protein DprA [Acidobacteriaceae bacterium]
MSSFPSFPAPRPLKTTGGQAETPVPLEPGAAPAGRLAWLALALTPGLGPRRILQAVDRVGSAEQVVRLPVTALEAQRFPAPAVQFLADGQAWKAAQQEAERLREMDATFLTYEEEAYPSRLREIFDPPPVLWCRGDVELLSRPGIAVVGTRQPSPYGSGMAELLSRDLATRGLLIMSGMARGIDTFAHRGAIQAKRSTVAIWGTGIDVIYPKENKALAEQILATGGVIATEQPLGTYPAPPNFPRRNRILSAISVGVLVVEAAEYSGSRVTARCAVEQNRDVYAVPGNVTNKNSWGPNALIKQGAKLVATWEDVWEDLPTQTRLEVEALCADFASEPAGTASLFKEEALLPTETGVMSVLRHDESLQLDEIMEQLEAEHSSSEVFTALFELELAGRIKQLPGKHYVKTF